MAGYTERTPRSWPEGTEPTTEQLAAWLAICTHGERAAFVNAARVAMDASHECFERNHEGQLRRLEGILSERRPLWLLPNTGQVIFK